MAEKDSNATLTIEEIKHLFQLIADKHSKAKDTGFFSELGDIKKDYGTMENEFLRMIRTKGVKNTKTTDQFKQLDMMVNSAREKLTAARNNATKNSIDDANDKLNAIIYGLENATSEESLAKYMAYAAVVTGQMKKKEYKRMKTFLDTIKMPAMESLTEAGDFIDPTYRNLYAIWKKRGEPTDLKSLYNMLRMDFDISRSELNDHVKSMQTRQPLIIKLSQEIKKLGLEQEAIEMITQHPNYSVKPKREPSKFGYKLGTLIHGDDEYKRQQREKSAIDRYFKMMKQESVNEDSSYSPEVIKKGIQMAASKPKDLKPYIKTWAEQIKKQQDENVKKGLVKKVINHLADNYNNPQWKQTIVGVMDIINKDQDLDKQFKTASLASLRSGKVMENDSFYICDVFLKECGLKWIDFDVRPHISEGGFELKPTVLERKALIESVEKMILLDKVANIKIGRRKKQ